MLVLLLEHYTGQSYFVSEIGDQHWYLDQANITTAPIYSLWLEFLSYKHLSIEGKIVVGLIISLVRDFLLIIFIVAVCNFAREDISIKVLILVGVIFAHPYVVLYSFRVAPDMLFSVALCAALYLYFIKQSDWFFVMLAVAGGVRPQAHIFSISFILVMLYLKMHGVSYILGSRKLPVGNMHLGCRFVTLVAWVFVFFIAFILQILPSYWGWIQSKTQRFLDMTDGFTIPRQIYCLFGCRESDAVAMFNAIDVSVISWSSIVLFMLNTLLVGGMCRPLSIFLIPVGLYFIPNLFTISHVRYLFPWLPIMLMISVWISVSERNYSKKIYERRDC